MALQHLRSGTADKRPIPTAMSAGQIAINTNQASPGLFFKDSNGDLVKVGPVHIGTDAPNSTPASTAATALVSGTVYQILTAGTTDFTQVGAADNNVGTIFTATGAGTGTGTVSGQQGVEKGEQWLDTTGGTYVLKIYDGTDWRSETGTFVDVAGDNMTGNLTLGTDKVVLNATSGAATFAGGNFDLASYGALSIKRTDGNNFPLFRWGTDTSYSGGGINPDGSATFANTVTLSRVINSTTSADPWLKGVNSSGTETSFIKKDGTAQFGPTSGSYVQLAQNSGVTINDGAIDLYQATSTTTAKPFKVQSDVGGTKVEKVSIQADGSATFAGNVGIGETTTVAAGLDVKRDFNPVLAIDRGTANTANFNLQYNGTLTGQLSAANGDFQISAGSSMSISFYTGGTEQLRIDSNGRLAIGTSTYAGNGQVAIAGNSSGSSAAGILDIRPTLSRPTAADTTLSLIRFGGADHTSNTGYASINVSSDGASSSEADLPGRLEFHTTSDGASSPTKKMQISSSGNVGIGKTSASRTTGGMFFVPSGTSEIIASGNNVTPLIIGSSDDVTLTLVDFTAASATPGGSISITSGTSVSYNTSSDYRLKENVIDIADGISRVKQLAPKRFNFIVDADRTVDGFLAHEAQAVVPEAVTGEKDGEEMQGIDQSKLVPLLTAALQEAIAKIESLETRIAALES